VTDKRRMKISDYLVVKRAVESPLIQELADQVRRETADLSDEERARLFQETDGPLDEPARKHRAAVEPIVTVDEVRAKKAQMEQQAGRHVGYKPIAKALGVSVATVRRRLAES
jgi:hypothetical protein